MWTYIESLIYWLRKNIRRLTLPSKISSDKLLQLPLTWYRGEIVVVEDSEVAASSISELLKESVIGFDTESKPAFKKGEFHNPSLVQLAGTNKVYLFQIEKIGGLDILLPLFSDKNVLKVGVGIEHDITVLQRITPFIGYGFYDLGELSRRMGIINTGLRNLAGIFLKKRISKSVQLSDWSQPVLTDKQKIYAATDAWISRLLYFHMKELE